MRAIRYERAVDDRLDRIEMALNAVMGGPAPAHHMQPSS
jgi:hypothetical protein